MDVSTSVWRYLGAVSCMEPATNFFSNVRFLRSQSKPIRFSQVTPGSSLIKMYTTGWKTNNRRKKL